MGRMPEHTFLFLIHEELAKTPVANASICVTLNTPVSNLRKDPFPYYTLKYGENS